MKEYPLHVQHQVTCILQWVACARRPLKVQEVLDGLVFQRERAVLNETTRLSKGILERCQPLIEEGAGSTINFVHFSAKEEVQSTQSWLLLILTFRIRYMLHTVSGPFIRPDLAHYNISLSCVTYLQTSLCFINGYCAEETLKLRVLKGLHRLHSYANEYWAYHVLEYTRLQGGLDQNCAKPLMQQLENLLQVRRSCQSQEFSIESRGNEIEHLSAEVSILSSTPLVKDLVHEVLAFQNTLTQERIAQKTPEGMFIYLGLKPSFAADCTELIDVQK